MRLMYAPEDHSIRTALNTPSLARTISHIYKQTSLSMDDILLDGSSDHQVTTPPWKKYMINALEAQFEESSSKTDLLPLIAEFYLVGDFIGQRILHEVVITILDTEPMTEVLDGVGQSIERVEPRLKDIAPGPKMLRAWRAREQKIREKGLAIPQDSIGANEHDCEGRTLCA
ncbi:hypothetical protein K491DRAFT_682760 [Lophiostoma macrostomum CBS 122681]|uniref:Uncharacterized protein n=1 Tax=Lophiostoma macrostomum CBS 122681 TaxID=1314788 RepID=A0A6A6SWY5_9PLEO|nr:hypothetical protein K491DRAFT_682760 [Lophiostoma macrostomum CBS 122681]